MLHFGALIFKEESVFANFKRHFLPKNKQNNQKNLADTI